MPCSTLGRFCEREDAVVNPSSDLEIFVLRRRFKALEIIIEDLYKLRILPEIKNGWTGSIKDKQGLNFLWTHAFTSIFCVLSGLLRSPDKNIFGPSRARDFRESLNARNLGEIMGFGVDFGNPEACKSPVSGSIIKTKTQDPKKGWPRAISPQYRGECL